jgi:hypothetical protein
MQCQEEEDEAGKARVGLVGRHDLSGDCRGRRWRNNMPTRSSIGNWSKPMCQSPQVRSASPQSKLAKEINQASGPLATFVSFTILPCASTTHTTVPMKHRFRHSARWLSSVSRCLGPTQRRDPVSSSIGGQPHQPLAHSRAHCGKIAGAKISSARAFWCRRLNHRLAISPTEASASLGSISWHRISIASAILLASQWQDERTQSTIVLVRPLRGQHK